MNINQSLLRSLTALAAAAGVLTLVGCASTGDNPKDSAAADAPGAGGTKFKTDDERTINLGRPSPSDDGVSYKNPHLDKCWVAKDFNFTGYDTIYIAPTLSTAKFNDKAKEDVKVHDLAKENLVMEMSRMLQHRKLAANVVTRENDLKPGVKTLKIENTILEFSKGGGAARMFVGLYGGGQPALRVQGKATDGDKTVFSYEARRSGVSAGARMNGVFMKDEDIQIEDIRSMVLDLTDVMAALAGKYTPSK